MCLQDFGVKCKICIYAFWLFFPNLWNTYIHVLSYVLIWIAITQLLDVIWTQAQYCHFINNSRNISMKLLIMHCLKALMSRVQLTRIKKMALLWQHFSRYIWRLFFFDLMFTGYTIMKNHTVKKVIVKPVVVLVSS